MEKIYLSSTITLIITLIVGAFFIILGHINLKKVPDNKSHIVGDRNEDTFSLTTSLTASALGAWILFGPASAATWGGIGAVIGYALGTAAPMLFLFNFGPKIRKEFPNIKFLFCNHVEWPIHMSAQVLPLELKNKIKDNIANYNFKE